MTVQSMITAARTRVRDTLIDEGTVTRPSSAAGTFDDETGEYTPAAGTLVYDGVCRVKKPNQVEQEIVFGDVNVSVARYLVNLPYDAPLLAVDDVFTATVSDDPEIVGVPMRVAVVVGKSVLMYRQLGCEVVER